MTLPPGEPEPAVREAIARAVAAGIEAASEALARLFAPAPTCMFAAQPLDGSSIVAVTQGIAIAFDMEGELRARLLVTLEPAEAGLLASALLRRPGLSAAEVEAQEALTEMGNILASAFLNGVAHRTRSALVPSTPTFAQQAGASFAALRLSRDRAWAARFVVELDGRTAEGLFIAAPEPEVDGAFEALFGPPR